MSFPRYPKYKPSGVEWLGEVPEGWEVFQLRRIVAEHRQGYYSTDPYVETGVKLLRITDLGESGAVNYDTCPRVEDRSDVGEFLLRNGDFVFARTGGAGSFGLIGEISERIAYASYLIRFRFCKNSLPGFLRFFFLSAGFKGGIQRDIHGGVNQNVHAQDIKNQCFAIPPLAEQTAIAEFLDRETGKIDGLVAEQKRLMELLKEKRQAVISHAVTKGLDPHAKMKPSGIEWLGDVPEHWRLPKLKGLATFSGGGTPSRDNPAYWNGDIPWVSPKDMKAEQIVGAEEAITNEGLSGSASNLLPPGRVLIVVRSGILKHTIPIAINGVAVALNQDMKALSFDSTKCDALFFLRWVQGHNEQLLFAWAKQGATVESIEHSYLAQTLIPLPDIHEQRAIVDYLETELAKFDTLTAEAQRAIDLLQERRTALISAAVTGQIDVRNQPRN